MKKNISINLQGIIFYIEDDGYEVLSRYIQEVKAYFASYQGHEEIVADIEGRIAELFAARITPSKQVITLADVEGMTAKMGRVSDFQASPDEEEEEPAYAEPTASPASNSRAAASGEPRRLYRDLAHRKIAGVCAGIAQYFLINPLVIRLGFLLLVLLPNLFRHRFPFPGVGLFDRDFDLPGLVVVLYIILWVALPKREDAPTPIDTLDLGGSLTGRKLFRDIDAGKVGGVAAGLAAYFRTDVVLVRVVLLLGAFLTFGSTIILYIILWIVVPEAHTVSEKMQMRGDAVTLSGIDSSLRSSVFEADALTPPNRPVGTFLEGAARTARPAVNFVGTLLRWVVAALLILIGSSLLLSVAISLGAALSIIPFTAVEHTNNGFVFDNSFGAVVRNLPPWGAIAGALVTGIPALLLILLGLRLLLRRSVVGRSAGLYLGLWLLGVVGSVAAGFQVARNFQAKGSYTTTVHFQPTASPSIVLDARNLEEHFKWVSFQVAPADSGAAPYVEQDFQARGRTQDAARLTAQQTMVYHIDQRDSTLLFDQGLTLRENAPARSQKLTLTLYLPLHKTYRLTPLFLEHLDDDDFTTGSRPNDNAPHRARLTREGKFTCLDCPATSRDEASSNGDSDEVVNVEAAGRKTQVRVNTDGNEPTFQVRTTVSKFNTDPGHYGTGRKSLNNPGDFNEIEASGGFRVLVRQGSSYKVEAAGGPEALAAVRLSIEGDRLVLRHRRNQDWLSEIFNSTSHPILVTVTLPRLRHLELSGACQAEVSGFRDEDLHLEASGASTAYLNVHVPRLTLDVSSASSANLSGSATELAIDGSSGSQVEALDLRASQVALDLSSGSQAKVTATNELKANLSSGSSAHYAGHPHNVEKDLSSGSVLEED